MGYDYGIQRQRQHAMLDLPFLVIYKLLYLIFLLRQLSEREELATMYMLSIGLKYIWEARVERKQVRLYKMRSEVEARVTILRKTRHPEAGNLMLEMMNL